MRRISCWQWKLAVLSLLTLLAIRALYQQVGCTWRGEMQLTDSIALKMKTMTDRPSGTFIYRHIDLFVDGHRRARLWCPPAPVATNLPSGFTALLCQGKNSTYILIKDEDSIWIYDLKDPSRVFTAFQETTAPTVMASGSMSNTGQRSTISDALQLKITFEDLLAQLNRKHYLLQRPE